MQSKSIGWSPYNTSLHWKAPIIWKPAESRDSFFFFIYIYIYAYIYVCGYICTEFIHWALWRTLMRTKYLFAHHTTSILAKLSTWWFEHSGDISCSLLINWSHTDESWEGRNMCMRIYIYILYTQFAKWTDWLVSVWFGTLNECIVLSYLILVLFICFMLYLFLSIDIINFIVCYCWCCCC